MGTRWHAMGQRLGHLQHLRRAVLQAALVDHHRLRNQADAGHHVQLVEGLAGAAQADQGHHLGAVEHRNIEPIVLETLLLSSEKTFLPVEIGTGQGLPGLGQAADQIIVPQRRFLGFEQRTLDHLGLGPAVLAVQRGQHEGVILDHAADEFHQAFQQLAQLGDAAEGHVQVDQRIGPAFLAGRQALHRVLSQIQHATEAFEQVGDEQGQGQRSEQQGNQRRQLDVVGAVEPGQAGEDRGKHADHEGDETKTEGIETAQPHQQ